MNADAQDIFETIFDPDRGGREIARRLATEAADAKKLSAADLPAIQVHVLLRGQVQPLFGSLSYGDGLLKVMTPSKVQHPGEDKPRDILLEQVFHASDVIALMFEREVKVERSSLILGMS